MKAAARVIFILFFFSTISVVLPACMGVSERAKALDRTTRAYEKTLRWGKYEMARGFRKGPQEFLTDSERRRLTNIRVTGYDMIHSQVSPDQSKATLLVRIRYYHDEYSIEKTITDQQRWVYNEEASRWQLESQVPGFR